MNMESGAMKMEASPSDQLKKFYEGYPEGTQGLILSSISMLEAKDPKFLKEVLESTKDLRELSVKLNKQAFERITNSGIEIANDSSSGSKLDAPNFMTDNGAYERYIAKQQKKTPFDGLSAEQSMKVIESFDEMGESDNYKQLAHSAQFRLLMAKSGMEQIKEKSDMGAILKLQEKLLPFTMLKAKFDGKIAKMKHAPGFAFEKLKSAMEGLLASNK